MNKLLNISVSIWRSFSFLLHKAKKLAYFSIGEKLMMVQNWFYGMKSSLDYNAWYSLSMSMQIKNVSPSKLSFLMIKLFSAPCDDFMAFLGLVHPGLKFPIPGRKPSYADSQITANVGKVIKTFTNFMLFVLFSFSFQGFIWFLVFSADLIHIWK